MPATASASQPAGGTESSDGLLVSIRFERSTVQVGERAHIFVTAHNAGATAVNYQAFDCEMGHFSLSLTPTPSFVQGRAAHWDGHPSRLQATFMAGGGELTGPILVGGTRVGAISYNVLCPDMLQLGRLGPGEMLAESYALDAFAPPGVQLAGTHSIRAVFTTFTPSGDRALAASAEMSLNITGEVPPPPSTGALEWAARAMPVSAWLANQPGPYATQSRWWRGAWEVLLCEREMSSQSEILRLRLDTAGALTDVRAVQNVSATSDDADATAPVRAERVLLGG